MVPLTRRRVLHGATALLAALGGCNDPISGSASSSHSVPPRDAENLETDPESYVLRGSEDRPLVWLRPENTDESDASETRDRRRTGPRHDLVADEDTAARLAFAENAVGVREPGDAAETPEPRRGSDAIDAARAFVEGTDFDSETLLIDPRRIGECYRLGLCYVTWSETEYHTYYGRFYRDADVACDADARDATVRLIRIPDVLDPEEVTGSGSGVHSGSCWRPPEERERSGRGGETTRSAEETTESETTRSAHESTDEASAADGTPGEASTEVASGGGS
jgi:hypothetical protein